MTQSATPQVANIIQGPRGIGARATGGAYTQDCQQDLADTDAFQGAPILLSGTTDALVPLNNSTTLAHSPGNYIVKTAGVNAMTIPTPTPGVDDGLSVNVWSDTANAHTITCATQVIAAGVALKTTITFPAFRGAGVSLRAFNGTWQIIGQGFTANTLS
jgi:hypothetical protein